MLKKGWGLLFGLVMCVQSAWAVFTVQTVPNPHTVNAKDYVCNPDALISQQTKTKINDICVSLHEKTGVELVFVLLGDIGESDAFYFSQNLFNTWGIGDKKANTGMLVFLAAQSHDVQLRTGGGLEGIMTDAVCSDIVYDIIIPLMREGKTDKAMMEAAEAIQAQLLSTSAQAELLLGYRPQKSHEGAFNFMSFICLFVMLIATWKYRRQPLCPHCAKRGSYKHNKVVVEPTTMSAGRGEKHYHCKCCGHEWIIPFTIASIAVSSAATGGAAYGSRSSWRGGGGLGGGSFGGGRSFGGGAGGKW